MPAIRAWRSESSPSVAEMSVRSSCAKLYGRAPVWRTSARSFASSDALEAADLRAAARDPVRVLDEVDRRERADLAVEDDREAAGGGLPLGVRGAVGDPELGGDLPPALGEVARDVVELVAALVA